MIVLRLRPGPAKDEVLTSWVMRLATEQAMRPSRLTNCLGLRGFWRQDPDLNATPEQLAVLAQATLRSPEQIGVLTLTPIKQQLMVRPDAARLPLLVLLGRHRGTTNITGHPACPGCLREGHAFLRSWRLATTVACPRHGVVLAESCRRCGAPISVTRAHFQKAQCAQTLPWTPERCWRCWELLPPGNMAPTPALTHALELQRLVEDAVHNRQARVGDLTLGAADLAGLLRPLTHVLLGLRAKLPPSAFDDLRVPLGLPPGVRAVGARPALELLPPAERFQVVALAGWLLRDGLVSLLPELRARGVRLTDLLAESDWPTPTWLKNLVHDQLARRPRQRRLTSLPTDFQRLTDEQWDRLAPLLTRAPGAVRIGTRARTPRDVFEGFLRRTTVGTTEDQWNHTPGVPRIKTTATHLSRWAGTGQLDGALSAMLDHLAEHGLVLEQSAAPALASSPPLWARQTLGALLAPRTLHVLARLGSIHHAPLWRAALRLGLQEVQTA